MFSFIILVIFFVFLYLYFKKPEYYDDQEPEETAMSVFKTLIEGDRLNEILNEPVPKLMSGSFGIVDAYENEKRNIVYAVTV